MMRFFAGPILGYLLAGLLAAVPAWFAAHNIGYASAMKEYRHERTVWLTREVLLWHELGAERQTKRELIESVEDIVNATGRARTRMLAELDAQKQRLATAEEAAAAAIKRLDYVESTWKDDTVPDAVVCVFNRAGCPEGDPGGALGGDAVAVRESASAELE